MNTIRPSSIRGDYELVNIRVCSCCDRESVQPRDLPPRDTCIRCDGDLGRVYLGYTFRCPTCNLRNTQVSEAGIVSADSLFNTHLMRETTCQHCSCSLGMGEIVTESGEKRRVIYHPEQKRSA